MRATNGVIGLFGLLLAGTAVAAPASTSTFVSETFEAPAPKVDILYVVDNTASMADTRMELSETFGYLKSELDAQGIDWHVGVVSMDLETSSHRGKLRQVDGFRYLDAATPKANARFRQMVLQGLGGNQTDATQAEGLGAAHVAIEYRNDGFNAGFLRPDAALAVVMVSDVDDQTDRALIEPREFSSWMESLKPDILRTSFSTFHVDGESCNTQEPTQASYCEVGARIGGIELDAQNQDWRGEIARLGSWLGERTRSVQLGERPEPSSLQVWVEADDGTTYDLIEGIGFELDADQASVKILDDQAIRGGLIHCEYELVQVP